MIGRQPHLEVCGEAADDTEAYNCINELQPDLVVVDISLQGCNGLDLIKQVRKDRPDLKMIVSTMHDERDYGERALRAGAVGYVNKQEPAGTILIAIARVLEGKLFFSERLIDRVMRCAVSGTPPSEDSPIGALSNRELEVFTLIGQGLTTEQIAAQLHLSRNTIGTYRERLKTKLDAPNGAALNRMAVNWTMDKD